MDTWIDLAMGPLFRIALAVCLLGLAYHLANATGQVVAAYRRAGDRRLPLAGAAAAALRWLLPLRLLRANPVHGVAAILFHWAIVLVPLFSAGHVRLWQASLPVPWPVLGPGMADALTLLGIAALVTILLARLLVAAGRQLTSLPDVLLLLTLLSLLASGWWAAHPTSSPLAPRAMLLAHVLLGDLALVLTPLSKIVHCALYPLTHLISELGWRFPAASGRHVATALAKENEPV